MWKIEKEKQPDIGAFLKKQINTEKEKKKPYIHIRASLVAQMIRNPPAMQETQVQSLGWEDPLEKGVTHYSLPYSCLEDSMDKGAWWARVHGVTNSQT